MRIKGLSFGYRKQLLFEDFSYECDEAIAILVGRTGCGKTTLLKLMARILAPEQCEAFDVVAQARLVLQEDALFPWLTAGENLSLVARDDGTHMNGRMRTSIAHLLERPVFELSVGQRRLVELCRALTDPPSLLLLDEPFNGLDPAARGLASDFISSVASAERQVILTTHHQEDIALFKAPVFRFPDTQPIICLAVETPGVSA